MSDDQQDFQTFIDVSSAVTGIDRKQLAPLIDPIKVGVEYFKTLNANVDPAVVDNLFTTYRKDKQAGQPDPQIAAALLADKVLGPVARSIIKMWLLGSWYPPKTPEAAEFVVSSQAYKESLVWKAMQSHPMGYSMFHFGQWAQEPPALDKFITFAGGAGGESSNG